MDDRMSVILKKGIVGSGWLTRMLKTFILISTRFLLRYVVDTYRLVSMNISRHTSAAVSFTHRIDFESPEAGPRSECGNVSFKYANLVTSKIRTLFESDIRAISSNMIPMRLNV